MSRARSHPAPAIRQPKQLRALASPVRQEIVDALETAGPCPIAELARHLGRAPDALYFHVRLLVRAGLVVEGERRQVGRHAFATYDVVARPMNIDRDAAARADVRRVTGGILRLALRDAVRGLEHEDAAFTGPRRNHWVARAQGWLDEAGLAELNRRLDQVLQLLRDHRHAPGRRAIAVAFAMTPAPRRRGAPDTERSRRRSTRRTGATR